MNTSLILAALAVIVFLLFVARLQKERREVVNRGINQSPIITFSKALGHTLERALFYFAAFYLVITAYYYLKFRQHCQATPRSQYTYTHATLQDHILEALKWPQHNLEHPPCLD